jgi:hypothetical protein
MPFFFLPFWFLNPHGEQEAALFSGYTGLLFLRNVYCFSLSIPTYLIKMFVSRRITMERGFKVRWIWSLFEAGYDFGITLALFKHFKKVSY